MCLRYPWILKNDIETHQEELCHFLRKLCHCPQEGNLGSVRTMDAQPGSTELLYELQNLGKDIDPPCWLTDSSFVIWGCRLPKLEISKFRTSRSLCSPSGSRGRETLSLSKPKTQGSAHGTRAEADVQRWP